MSMQLIYHVLDFLQDKCHTNSNGTALLDFYKQTSLRILNGRCADDDGIGKYTFIGSRECSLVDYVLGSESILISFLHLQSMIPILYLTIV